MPDMFVEITPPAGNWAAPRIKIRLQGPMADIFTRQNKLTFPLQNPPGRFFRAADSRFVAPPAAGEEHWRGSFFGGRWEGFVQANGVDEASNPTSIEVVRESLIATLEKILEPWRGLADLHSSPRR